MTVSVEVVMLAGLAADVVFDVGETRERVLVRVVVGPIKVRVVVRFAVALGTALMP